MKKAYFAGGCFWCITPMFKLYGVNDVICGYSGGDEVNPSYEDVKAQRTGHRETLQLTYDSDRVGYEKLLDIYLANIDPFDEGGQYIDRGHSYTLAIYVNDDSEEKMAREKIAELEQSEGKAAFISVERFKSFYPAEEYHQDFYLKEPKRFEQELIESGRKKSV